MDHFVLFFFEFTKVLLMFGGAVLLTVYGAAFVKKAPVIFVLLICLLLSVLVASRYLIPEISLTFSLANLVVILIAGFVVWALVWKYYKAAVRKTERSVFKFVEQCVSEIPNVGVIITDSSDLIVRTNSSAGSMFGYHKDELIGSRIGKLFQPGDLGYRDIDKPYYFLNFDRDAKHGVLEGRRKDGLALDVAVAARSVRTADGDFNLLFITESNAAAAVRSLDNIAPEHQRIDRLAPIKSAYYDFAPMIFLTLNASGVILTINQYGCKLVACDPDDIIDTNWINTFVAASDRDQFIMIIHDCLKKREEKVFRSHARDRQSNQKLIQWRCGTDPHNGVVLCVGEDITEREAQNVALRQSLNNVNRLKRKLEERVRRRTRELEMINVDLELQIDERRQIEDQLINSQRLYSAIAHNFPNGLIAVLDPKLNFMMIDGRELAVLGLSANELIGKCIFDGTHSLVDESSRNHMENVLAGQSATFEVVRHSSVYNVIALPLYDQQDTIFAILLVMQNITESKHLEESLYKAIEQEKKLNDLKSRFVTMASHEFRTPLSTILSSLFLLESYSGELYEEKKHLHINRIKRTVNMLTETLNDFLRLGKLEEGRVEMILSEVDIRELAEDIIRELQSVTRPGQTIHYVHDGLDLGVLIDKNLLRGILTNLLSNAVKYSPDGGDIYLNTLASPEELQMIVIDRGIGIAPEEQENIFQRFFRALNAVNIEGTGLGLHIVKKYVELMNGTIGFSSGDRGTTFTVKIPLKLTPDNARLILT